MSAVVASASSKHENEKTKGPDEVCKATEFLDVKISNESEGSTSKDPTATTSNADAGTTVTNGKADKESFSTIENNKASLTAQTNDVQQERQVENAIITTNTVVSGEISSKSKRNQTTGSRAKKHDILESTDSQLNSPLPQDLLKILTEVASTGFSTSLSWAEEYGVRNHSMHANYSSGQSSGHNTPLESQSNIASHTSSNTNVNRQQLYISNGNYKRARTASGRSNGISQPRNVHRQSYSGGGTGTLTTTTTSTASASIVSSGASPVISVGGQVITAGQAAAASATSSRKKYRNGLHPRPSSGRRFADGGNVGGRKRPLFLIRTSNASASMFSPGSVGSGRTSGSEPEDTSQYECDSEGTSATSNSELSFDQGRLDRGGSGGGSRICDGYSSLRNRGISQHRDQIGNIPLANVAEGVLGQMKYNCLKDAFRTALNLVLNHFYANRGGYRLSPAENLKNAEILNEKDPQSLVTNLITEDNDERKATPDVVTERKDREFGNATDAETKTTSINYKQKLVFQKRKQLLLNMLGLSAAPSNSSERRNSFSQSTQIGTVTQIGPPFTIQRVAEVLVAPERYYTQTHKLCNCLEKLLLVHSPANAFGGSRGGITSQSRREETELAALADEKGRQQAEFRQAQRRLRRKTGSPLSDEATASDLRDRATEGSHSKKKSSPEKNMPSSSTERGDGDRDDDEEDSQELLEAAARASLRTKFDHVGIDPHSSSDPRSLVENRGMTNSPPPPSLGIAAASGIVLPGGHTSLLRHNPHGSPTSPSSDKDIAMARSSSPILFNNASGTEGSSPPLAPIHANPANIHLLQMHHAATLGGGQTGLSPFELTALNASEANSAGHALSSREMEVDCRSSASSDVDSESDVSFDDSASDRSDGSDSGQQHYEPLTAARAMALNRMHQQQRLQSRVLTSLQHHGGEGFRPPADSEYQSGDSVDSMRAEDSGGSDSSYSSDVAD